MNHGVSSEENRNIAFREALSTEPELSWFSPPPDGSRGRTMVDETDER